MSEHSQRAKDIVEKIIYITIATTDREGNPWNSPAYSAYDENYNFYWASWKENQHSKNIAENGRTFLVVYDSTVPEGTGEGVYIQAKAEMLTDEQEIAHALSLLYKRKGADPKKRSPQEFLGDHPRRVYKATPQKIWVNDEGDVNGEYVDKRVEIEL